MPYKRVLYEKIDPDILKITMNRPEKRNAQDHLLIEEVSDAFVEADLDSDVKVILLAGAGKDFSAGHDQSGKGEEAEGPILGKVARSKMTGSEKDFMFRNYSDFRQALLIRNVSKPTIAMVQGSCFGGGWVVAAMCDLIVATEDAQFTDPLSRMAAAAGSEVLWHPYDLGFRRAKELLWTAEPLSVQEAKQIGFVSRIVPREKLLEETLKLARRIASSKPVAVSLIKKSINHAWDEMGQRNSWEYHLLIQSFSHTTDESKRWSAERKKIKEEEGMKGFFKTRE